MTSRFFVASPSWPEHALVRRRDRTNTLEHELLDALPLVGLRRVEVALRIRRDAVDGEELAGLTAAAAERGEHVERLPVEDVDLHVGAIGDVQEALLRVARERDVPH